LAKNAEEAYALLQTFKQAPSEETQNFAYEKLEPVIEIAVRQAFSRCPARHILDDLRQAARLRLFQLIPKLSELCDGPEYYFRLAIQISRRAMLSEYARLRRQSFREVSLQDRSSQSSDSEVTYEDTLEQIESDPFITLNHEFDLFEQRLLLDQTTTVIYSKAKKELVRIFQSEAYKEAAVFTLLMVFKGHDPSPSWLHDTYGIAEPEKMRQYVILTLRRVIDNG